MATILPKNLIFEDSRMRIHFEERVKVNRTRSAIVMEGSRNGFLTLANAILYFVNDLQSKIPFDFPFVQADISFSIECDETVASSKDGEVFATSDNEFVWKLSEESVCSVASDIHSLGHHNSELHFDEGKSSADISVYCVVEA